MLAARVPFAAPCAQIDLTAIARDDADRSGRYSRNAVSMLSSITGFADPGT
jgi:hypothetical protein